ncbi:MAG: 3-isopropylmalate dehydrogenase [Sporomusaceae bacterium]|nr:3-isopropylmalate dehydrogenase [Sporomusaceae bacterium]
MSYQITVIGGDGIGPEIVAAAEPILAQALQKCHKNVTFTAALAGGAALDAAGIPLPTATIEACRKADAILLGAVGGPKWDQVAPELRAEKAILGLRQELKLFANLRPIRVSKALMERSPLKTELVDGVDIMIVRELNGGIYFGERQEGNEAAGLTSAYDKEEYTVAEIERIAAVAVAAAKLRSRRITSVDKANVLATSRLWRRTMDRIAAKESELEIKHLYVDNCAMQLILNPKQFDVIVTSNLFGDILSDEAAVLTGSIGMLPSASLGEGPGLYEPIHGSAPDIAGQDLANPLGTILAAAMLLRYSLKEENAATLIEQAVDNVLAQGYRTGDLYEIGFTKVSTSKMGELVAAELAKL